MKNIKPDVLLNISLHYDLIINLNGTLTIIRAFFKLVLTNAYVNREKMEVDEDPQAMDNIFEGQHLANTSWQVWTLLKKGCLLLNIVVIS